MCRNATNGSEPTIQQLLSSREQLPYFHAPDASSKILEDCQGRSVILEIDVAMTSDLDFEHAIPNSPYIGHPSPFYEMSHTSFPPSNVSLEQFKEYLLKPGNESIKVLLDIKNKEVIPYILEFAKDVGRGRCIAHAFISDWTRYPQPPEIPIEPHWIDEDLSLEVVDEALQSLEIPLIANCRGFSNDHVEQHKLVQKMVEDAIGHKSIAALGLYYAAPETPHLDFLRGFNKAGYKAWINANTNLEVYEDIQWVGMCDDLNQAILLGTDQKGSSANRLPAPCVATGVSNNNSY